MRTGAKGEDLVLHVNVCQRAPTTEAVNNQADGVAQPAGISQDLSSA